MESDVILHRAGGKARRLAPLAGCPTHGYTGPVTLSGKQRRYLRSLAHHLDPVVQLGRKGTTDAVLQQLDDALETHELLKVRLGRDCPQSGPEAASWIEGHLAAEVVQIVGHVLVVYRRRDDDPSIELPRSTGGEPD